LRVHGGIDAQKSAWHAGTALEAAHRVMHATLPLHGELPAPATRPRLALAGKGFRPFFLLAAAFAVAVVPLWLLVLRGAFDPGSYLGAMSWHAHEMVFGFAVAVIAGFLLTAVGNWTQRETVVGLPLLALAGLWVAGRVAILCAGAIPRGIAAATDLAFLPVLIAVIARPIVASGNRRNFVMVVFLAALFLANVAVHLDALGVLPGWGHGGSLVAVDVIVLVVLVIAGRVFPMFTRNATGATSIRSHRWLDRVALGGMAALVVLDVVAPLAAVTAVVSGVVGIAAAARAANWGTLRTARHPLLWILHLGYAWIPIGLVLRAASAFTGPVSSSAATHALTAGANGSLTLGMMARVTLGHTGRALRPPRPVVLAFVLVLVAGAVRVAAPSVAPLHYVACLTVAGTLWSAAFALYLVAFAPALLTPRSDGKAG
jgi:uncharacterized protein involved in response to NO